MLQRKKNTVSAESGKKRGASVPASNKLTADATKKSSEKKKIEITNVKNLEKVAVKSIARRHQKRLQLVGKRAISTFLEIKGNKMLIILKFYI